MVSAPFNVFISHFWTLSTDCFMVSLSAFKAFVSGAINTTPTRTCMHATPCPRCCKLVVLDRSITIDPSCMGLAWERASCFLCNDFLKVFAEYYFYLFYFLVLWIRCLRHLVLSSIDPGSVPAQRLATFWSGGPPRDLMGLDRWSLSCGPCYQHAGDTLVLSWT
jgi:hypothetical protein